MKRCSDMNYHYGVVLKIYPSDVQKHIIAVNDGAQRAVYNRLVASGNEIYRLSKTADIVPADKARLEDVICSYRNPEQKNPSPDPKRIKNALPFLNEKTVDSQVA